MKIQQASPRERGPVHALTATAKTVVRCFRGIEHAEIPLTPITIITGRNNSGKSSILEAIALGFTALNNFRDWHGNDVVRAIIDRKLSGRPYWLLRSRCRESLINSVTPWGHTSIILRRPGREFARKLACKVIDLLDEKQLAPCFIILSETRSLEDSISSFLALWAPIVEDLFEALKNKCSSKPSSGKAPRKIPKEITSHLADTLFTGLRNSVRRIVNTSIEVETHSDSCRENLELKRVYYPGNGFLSYAKNHVRHSLKTSIHRVVEAITTYTSSKVDKEALTECIMDTIESAILKTVSADNTSQRLRYDRYDNRVNVFVVFYRLVASSHGGLVETLTKTIKGLHRLGLLGEYNSLLNSVPGLGLSDPFIEEREIWFRTISGESIAARLLGDGALHLLLLLAGLALARGGNAVIVYEEPETGLHPGYMDVFAKQLVKTVTSSRHSFVTLSTHSLELIRYIVDAAKEEKAVQLLTAILMYEGEVFSIFRGTEVSEAASKFEVDLRGL